MSGGIKKVFKKVVPIAIMGAMAYFTGGAALGAMGLGGAGATGGMLAASNAAGGVMGAGASAASGGILGSIGGMAKSLFGNAVSSVGKGIIQNAMSGGDASTSSEEMRQGEGREFSGLPSNVTTSGSNIGGLPGWLTKNPEILSVAAKAAQGYSEGKAEDERIAEAARLARNKNVHTGSFWGTNANGLISRGRVA